MSRSPSSNLLSCRHRAGTVAVAAVALALVASACNSSTRTVPPTTLPPPSGSAGLAPGGSATGSVLSKATGSPQVSGALPAGRVAVVPAVPG